MTEIVIKFSKDLYFTHVMIVPKQLTYGEVISRLKLKYIWRYLFMCKERNGKVKIINENSKPIVNHSTITIYKPSISPIFSYKKVSQIVEYIKKDNENVDDTKYIVIWFNYDCNNHSNNNLEPILIYFIYKENQIWNEITLSAIDFKEVDRSIEENVFLMTKMAKERYEELKEEYS